MLFQDLERKNPDIIKRMFRSNPSKLNVQYFNLICDFFHTRTVNTAHHADVRLLFAQLRYAN